MSYISTEKVKEIREALKAKYPKARFSVVREHFSSIRVCVMKSVHNFPPHESVNHYYIGDHYQGAQKTFLQGVADILGKDVKTVSVDGDYGNIPNFYVTLQIGQWDKPHVKINGK